MAIREALGTVPRSFALHDRAGAPVVRYGAGVVHFDPGSSCVHVLDPETGRHRDSQAADLVRLVQVAEQLPAYAAQSTAVVCGDVPEGIGDLYRLFLVLWHSDKPVVTGAFSAASTEAMLDLLAAESGSREAMARQPRAIFDVCPSPPLHWSEFAAEQTGSESTPGDGLLVAGVGRTIVGNTMTGNTGIGLSLHVDVGVLDVRTQQLPKQPRVRRQSLHGRSDVVLPGPCNETLNNPTTFGDNLIPGPPLF